MENQDDIKIKEKIKEMINSIIENRDTFMDGVIPIWWINQELNEKLVKDGLSFDYKKFLYLIDDMIKENDDFIRKKIV
jgi:hypothetical protein